MRQRQRQGDQQQDQGDQQQEQGHRQGPQDAPKELDAASAEQRLRRQVREDEERGKQHS